MGTASEEDYLNEIAELRKKVNEQDQENKALREQNRQIKKAQGEADKLISKYQSERDEYILNIAPVILGEGIPLFCEGERKDLVFNKARTFGQFLEVSYHTDK